jgi:hypothetical protein
MARFICIVDHCIPGWGAILKKKFRMSWTPSRIFLWASWIPFCTTGYNCFTHALRSLSWVHAFLNWLVENLSVVLVQSVSAVVHRPGFGLEFLRFSSCRQNPVFFVVSFLASLDPDLVGCLSSYLTNRNKCHILLCLGCCPCRVITCRHQPSRRYWYPENYRIIVLLGL